MKNYIFQPLLFKNEKVNKKYEYFNFNIQGYSCIREVK